MIPARPLADAASGSWRRARAWAAASQRYSESEQERDAAPVRRGRRTKWWSVVPFWPGLAWCRRPSWRVPRAPRTIGPPARS